MISDLNGNQKNLYSLIHVFGVIQGNYNSKKLPSPIASLPGKPESVSGMLSKGNFATFSHGLIHTMPIIVNVCSRSKIF